MALLHLNQPAPEFSGTAVINEIFNDINSGQYLGKYLVLFFYPLDFSFVCPTELTMISDRIEEFQSINCEVIGISTDSHFSHLTWKQIPREKGGLGQIRFPLLADKSGKISRDYGVFDEKTGTANRGFFIIDDKNLIRTVTINDLSVGRSIDEILRLVEAIQFTDVNGEACPANWKPGERTIKTDPIESKLYFLKANHLDIYKKYSVLKDSTISNQTKSTDEHRSSDESSKLTENQSKITASTAYSSIEEISLTDTQLSMADHKKIPLIDSTMSELPSLVVDNKKPVFKQADATKSAISASPTIGTDTKKSSQKKIDETKSALSYGTINPDDIEE